MGTAEYDVFPGTPCPFNTQHFYSQGKFTNDCDHFHYWSVHPGGANWVLADGSVRFIAYDTAIVQPLATRAGGEVASVP
jgi:prepilin-type processing-associated H-X9-DG protein